MSSVRILSLPTRPKLLEDSKDEAVEAVEEEAPKEGGPLRKQVSILLSERRDAVKKAVTKWILFNVDFGCTQVYLDDCPVALSRFDKSFVLDWLGNEEGFKVHAPMLWGKGWGRPIIYLES